ncbi:hypothetical protein EYF80_010506 [Liparis tanakae]|uniref:Uncharacterized protein n=1 Tax=Liparis tanakae TaxID=230148 RepID=A0A4Z2IN97_9TELE|nr:hypothetical protein EYF80_010506 [Liparis tanakae]
MGVSVLPRCSDHVVDANSVGVKAEFIVSSDSEVFESFHLLDCQTVEGNPQSSLSGEGDGDSAEVREVVKDEGKEMGKEEARDVGKEEGKGWLDW